MLGEGDPAFERSRGAAEAKLEKFVNEARGAKSAESLVQTLHEIKYGSKIQSYPVAKLAEVWDLMPKRRASHHPRYVSAVKATIADFQSHLLKNHPAIVEASQVTRTIARAYLQSPDITRLAAKSWNDVLKRLRGVFNFLRIEYGVLNNPFDGLKSRKEDHVHRLPLTAKEVGRLLKAAAADDFCRPLIVCGLSTAMRRGDCCLLKWADVHLDGPNPSITVKTGKTGETVQIPVYTALRKELDLAAGRSQGKGEYVWPEQARMQMENQQGVSWRLRRVFEEAKIGEGKLTVARAHGTRVASVRDFHSLRTTWITEALARGIPMETVKLISGHRTTEVVTQHYFRPSQDQLRRTLDKSLPKLLTGGGGAKDDDPVDRACEILESMTADTWQDARDRALKILKKAG